MSTRYRPYYLRALFVALACAGLIVQANTYSNAVTFHRTLPPWFGVKPCASGEWVPDFRQGSPTYGTPICKVTK